MVGELRLQLGEIHRKLEEYKLAREQFEKVLQIEEMEETALFYIARLECSAGNNIASIDKYRELLEKYPTSKYRLEALNSIKTISVLNKLLAKRK